MRGMDEYDNPTTTLARVYFNPYNDTKVRIYLQEHEDVCILVHTYICINSLSVILQNIDVKFHPDVILVGPDPKTGLLTSQFTIFYEVSNVSSDTIDGPLGEVVLQDLDLAVIVRFKH